MNDNLISEIIDLNKVKANLMELQKMWEQLITTMAAKSSKDLKFDNLAQNLKTVTTAEKELANVKQAGLEVDKKKVKITAEIIANYDKYGKEEQKIIENEIKRKHEIRETNKLLKDRFTNEQDLIKVLQRETKSIADLDKQNKDLQRIQQKLNLTTKEGLDANEKINAQISKNKETIKQYTNEIDKQRRNVGNYQGAVDTVNMSLGEMRKELRALRDMSFAGLSPEEIKQVRDRMAELTDGIGDFQAQINTASADAIPAIMDGLQGLVAVAQGVTGTLAMFGIETEKLDKAMVQLIGISQALKTAQELQEKGTIKVMLATIKDTAAKTANAVAAKGQAMATNGATKAVRALGRVMKSNPYGVITAAAAAAVTAIVALVKALKAQNDEMKKMSEEEQRLTRLRKANIEVSNKAAESYASVEVSLRAYQKIVNDTNKTDEERFAALEEIKKATNGVVTATDLSTGSLTSLNDQLDRYIETSFDAAMAQAAINLATEEFSKILEAQQDMEQFKPGFWKRIGTSIKNYFLSSGNSYVAIARDASDFAKQTIENQQEAIDKAEEMMETYKGIAAELMTAVFERAKAEQEALRALREKEKELRELERAAEAAKKRYQDYLGAIKKANEEAKLSIELGENANEVRVKELEAIYAATKAYYELNGYTADEIKHLKELRAEIDKVNAKIEEEKKAIEEVNKAIEKQNKAIEEANKAREEENKRYQDYLDAVKKANEEAKLQIALGEDATDVRKRELEAIYAATKAYVELNGYTADEIEKLKKLRDEIDKLNTKIEEETVETISKFKKVFNDFFGTTEPIENWKDTFKESVSQVVNESLEIFNNLIDMQSNQLEHELEAINTLYDKQVSTLDDAYEKRKSLLEATIDDEEELAEALARIEEEKTANYNKMQDEKIAKEQEVAKKQAILEKKRAKMEVAVGSARALVEAIKLLGIATSTAAPGDPYSVVARIAAALAAALTVVGAVTSGIAKVKAIQIPEFWAGGEAQEGQLISVAERGRELAIGESGQSYMFDKQSVIIAPENMRIFSNKETNKIMEKQTINNVYEKSNNVSLTIAIDNERHKKYFKLN